MKQPSIPSTVLSNCSCHKVAYEGSCLICEHVSLWLQHVEQRTDLKLDYARAKETYTRVQGKKSQHSLDEQQI